MKTVREILDWAFDRSDMFEMSNIPTRRTGCRYQVWVDKDDGYRHGPRVKVWVQNSRDKRDLIVVTIAESPMVMKRPKYHVSEEIFAQIREFVTLNRAELLHFWNDREMAPDDLFDVLRPINGK
jgi:hypothetical protein